MSVRDIEVGNEHPEPTFDTEPVEAPILVKVQFQ
jgi:hypothetical protein